MVCFVFVCALPHPSSHVAAAVAAGEWKRRFGDVTGPRRYTRSDYKCLPLCALSLLCIDWTKS